MRRRLAVALACGLVLGLAADCAAAAEPALIPDGTYDSILPQVDGATSTAVAPYALDRMPVTNAEFLAFVRAHPEWRRDRVARLFADERYLAHWAGPDKLGDARPAQPVVHVSWFAAKAYCEARGARLPTWYEWELAAAANASSRDARSDPAWRQQILDWYAQPSSLPLPDVGGGAANVYGVADLHGLVWEWVLDFNALLVSDDSREQGGADIARFCGEGALSAADREQYAVLMRIAFLSSLEARYTTRNLGFRCAWDR
jgi:formylglycine-generating enzyme required for sulfatase activity